MRASCNYVIIMFPWIDSTPGHQTAVTAFPSATRCAKSIREKVRRFCWQQNRQWKVPFRICKWLADKITFTTRNGHWQSRRSPIGCEGLCFLAMSKNKVSVSGWPPIVWSFHTNLIIPSPFTTSVLNLWVLPGFRVPFLPRLLLGQHLQTHSDRALIIVF